MIRGDLQQIPVTGYQRYFHSLLLCFLCKGSQNIIRFQSSLLHDGNMHGLQDFLHDRHLLS